MTGPRAFIAAAWLLLPHGWNLAALLVGMGWALARQRAQDGVWVDLHPSLSATTVPEVA